MLSGLKHKFRLYRRTTTEVLEVSAQHPKLDIASDIWKLEQFARQHIFIYDDMMTGGKNNRMVAEASFCSQPTWPVAYTLNPYTFWVKDLGKHSFPIVLPANYRPTGHVRWPVEPFRIKGELWSIRPVQFKKVLDEAKQNGVQFRRERIPITLPYRQVAWSRDRPQPKISPDCLYTVTAWMYIGIPEYWDAQIGGIFAGSQVDPREHEVPRLWIDKFYKFDLKDH